MMRIHYVLVMLFAKTAILLEWTRIFVPPGTRNKFYWAGRALMVINILVYTAGIVITTVLCVPMSKLWQPWKEGRCFDRIIGEVVTAWINLFIDIALLALSHRVIWTLKMSTARKLGISLVFSVGLLYV